MNQETYNLITAYTLIISSVIALFMLGLTILQLSKIAEQAKAAIEQAKAAAQANILNRLNSLLEIEDQLAKRRQTLSEAGIELVELGKTGDKDKLDAVSLRYNEAVQMYLNGLDRLCFCVEKGYLSDDEIRLEYRDIISRAVTDFQKEFMTASPYRNIKKVYDRWADK